MRKKRKLSFSQFQGSQTREGILNMLLQDPELFERIPGSRKSSGKPMKDREGGC